MMKNKFTHCIKHQHQCGASLRSNTISPKYVFLPTAEQSKKKGHLKKQVGSPTRARAGFLKVGRLKMGGPHLVFQYEGCPVFVEMNIDKFRHVWTRSDKFEGD